MTAAPAAQAFAHSAKLTLDQINHLDQTGFTKALGFAFELSPWVVERAHAAGPFASLEALHSAMMAVLTAAPEADQLALIRAHPELAGKAAIAKALTAESLREQAGAGLDRLTEAEYARFHALNAAYGQRFGFPFIICARLNDKTSILTAMEARLAHSDAAEIAEAIAQIGLISRLRLEDAVVEPIPAGGLTALNAAVRRDLDLLDFHSPSWVRPRTGVIDVIIIGGGQSGLGAAFGLMREKVRNILVLDENPPGAEGPWATYARMLTLRTPKHLTTIDFGQPNLTFRAWWEAQHGLAGWEALDKIPREQWMAYLRWFRAVLDIPVRNLAKVVAVQAAEPGQFTVQLATGETLTARKVILATGIQGGGEWHAPPFITQALPPHRWAHTSQAIDFEALRGKRVAILGGGASAFDNAQHGLKQGVGTVDVFIRRPALPQVNPIRFMEAAGFSRHFANFDDAAKYAVIDSFLERNQPPTNDTFSRAAAYPGFSLHVGSPWLKVEDGAGGVTVTTPKGQFEFDFLILSTGMKTDAALRPELASLAPHIALWKDRHQPDGRRNPLIDDHPYLGPGFEFQAKTPEGAGLLRGLFAFNYSALASLGLSASALSGMKFALPKLVHAVTGQLFMDDGPQILADFYAYDQPEFVSAWPPTSA